MIRTIDMRLVGVKPLPKQTDADVSSNDPIDEQHALSPNCIWKRNL